MSIEERWSRWRVRASASYARERHEMGDEFRPETVRGTIGQYRAISEMADLASGLLPSGPQAQSLRTAAAALESAGVLWLQDVDESITCMRTALEATSPTVRPRTFRRDEEESTAPRPAEDVAVIMVGHAS